MSRQSGDALAAEAAPLPRLTRLVDAVHGAIYAQLMSHKVPPGGRISIDSLARELGVSQTPIREALSRLEAQGLVVKTHLVGYRAAGPMDRRRLAELYELRLLIEPHGAGAAAASMTGESIDALHRLVAEMRAAFGEAQPSYGRFARLDGAFHELIAEGSGNRLVYETFANLHVHVHLFRLFHHAQASADSVEEHGRIAAAIAARDGGAAEAAMRHHIEASRGRFTDHRDGG